MGTVDATTRSSATDAAAHTQLMRDTSIQFSLPDYQPPSPPPWLRPLLAVIRAVAPAMPYVFWSIFILGFAIILMLIVREMLGLDFRFRRRRPAGTLEEEWQPDVTAAQILLSEADALAAAGEYDAAVHMLLQRSVEDIAERLPRFLSPSLTARDIATATELPPAPRTAFATIAAVAEAAVFAHAPVGVAGWARAREAYGQFALGGSWRTPPSPREQRLVAA